MNSELIRSARKLAEESFRDAVFENRPFHNLQHTKEVVDAVEEIGKRSELNEDELESVIIAAWLHDTGYIQGAANHEEAAAEKARTLLVSMHASPTKITDVTEAIMATKVPQQPRTMIAKVLCDADMHHLATDSFQEKASHLRDEWKRTKGESYSDLDWAQLNLTFMRNHQYHTPYGQTALESAKRKNVKHLKKQLEREASVGGEQYGELQDEIIKLRSKLEKERILKPDRGIETMFRTTSTNHVMLSQMADNKANILITVNSIIVSLVVSVLGRKLDENPNLLIRTILLISVSLATTVFAILALRPNVTAGRFNREDIKNKKTNLLFFGNFHGMEIENYEWAMKQMMRDGDYLYSSLIKDIYYLGKVLGKKYKYLRISYNVFMFGFVVAVLSFVIAFFFAT